MYWSSLCEDLTEKSLKIENICADQPIKFQKGYMASKRAHGIPKHMIYVDAAWTMIWKENKD